MVTSNIPSLQLFSATTQRQVDSSTIALNAAISACEKSGNWEKASQLFSLMAHCKKELETIAYSAVIRACEKGGRPEKALRMFSLMESSRWKDLANASLETGNTQDGI